MRQYLPQLVLRQAARIRTKFSTMLDSIKKKEIYVKASECSKFI